MYFDQGVQSSHLGRCRTLLKLDDTGNTFTKNALWNPIKFSLPYI